MLFRSLYVPKAVFILIITDFLVIVSANAIGLNRLYGPIGPRYVFFTLAIAALWLFSIYIADGYQLKRISEASYNLKTLATGATLTIAVLIVTAAYAIYKGRINVGQSFLTFVFLPFVALLVERLIVQRFILRDVSRFSRGVLVVGTGELARELGKVLRDRREFGYRLVTVYSDEEAGGNPEGLKIDGTHDVMSLCREHNIRVLAVEGESDLPAEVAIEATRGRLKVLKAEELYEWLSRKVLLFDLNPNEEHNSNIESIFRRKPISDILTRLISLVLASIGLLLALIVAPFIIIGIKLDSEGRIFFVHERVGKDGRIFKLVKFRTMSETDREASEQEQIDWMKTSVHEAERPRLTRFGRFLRKYNLDEIPQLINVLKGDMNLVGPRPEQPQAFQARSKLIPGYAERIRVKPGITSWASIHYPFEDAREKLQYDLFYIKHRSPLLDLVILLRTIRINLLTGREVT